jgi:enoyl-CoA hydratase/carnithine racemase
MIFLTSGDLETADLDAIVSDREMTVAFANGQLRGHSLATALHCDWSAIEAGSVIVIDSPQAWSGAVGRIGARAYRLHLLGRSTMNAEEAVREGLADALVPIGADPVEWFAEWLSGRSTLALDTAAALIRGRCGDMTERIAFARLFATGEPQEGVGAFLEKRRPKWIRE